MRQEPSFHRRIESARGGARRGRRNLSAKQATRRVLPSRSCLARGGTSLRTPGVVRHYSRWGREGGIPFLSGGVHTPLLPFFFSVFCTLQGSLVFFILFSRMDGSHRLYSFVRLLPRYFGRSRKVFAIPSLYAFPPLHTSCSSGRYCTWSSLRTTRYQEPTIRSNVFLSSSERHDVGKQDRV